MARQLVLALLLLVYGYSRPTSTSRQQIVAGLALGAATGIKLFMAALILYFWLYGRRRIAAAGAVAFGLTVLVGVAGAGWATTSRYVTEFLPWLMSDRNLFWLNYSIGPTLERMSSTVAYEFRYFFMASPMTACSARCSW